jgi:hypothetical protein
MLKLNYHIMIKVILLNLNESLNSRKGNAKVKLSYNDSSNTYVLLRIFEEKNRKW